MKDIAYLLCNIDSNDEGASTKAEIALDEYIEEAKSQDHKWQLVVMYQVKVVSTTYTDGIETKYEEIVSGGYCEFLKTKEDAIFYEKYIRNEYDSFSNKGNYYSCITEVIGKAEEVEIEEE